MILKNTKVGFCTIALLFVTSVASALEGKAIKSVGEYFPDTEGMSWIYQGTINEKMQQIATYTNRSTAKGKMKKDGVDVQLFTESNQANEGPAENYFSRNADSIVYHGGLPSTPFEDRLVPYLVIKFPLFIGETFTQVQKKVIPFGQDLDGDSIEELADVMAEVTVAGFETVSVPAGVFKDALKLNGMMTVRVTLSKNNEVFELVDKTSNWFVRKIGMVKGYELIQFPEVDNIPATATVIKEALEELPKMSSTTH